MVCCVVNTARDGGQEQIRNVGKSSKVLKKKEKNVYKGKKLVLSVFEELSKNWFFRDLLEMF